MSACEISPWPSRAVVIGARVAGLPAFWPSFQREMSWFLWVLFRDWPRAIAVATIEWFFGFMRLLGRVEDERFSWDVSSSLVIFREGGGFHPPCVICGPGWVRTNDQPVMSRLLYR